MTPPISRLAWPASGAGLNRRRTPYRPARTTSTSKTPLYKRPSRGPGGKRQSWRVRITGFSAGEPRILFDGLRIAGGPQGEQDSYRMSVPGQPLDSVPYDVFPDGEHFVVFVGEPESNPRQLRVVLNWFEELKRLAPSEE